MNRNLRKLSWSQYRAIIICVGLLALFLLILPVLFFRHNYMLTRSLLIPAWPIPSSSQSNIGDWIKIDLISPTVENEIPVNMNKVVFRVQYSLKSQPSATLLIQLRSRLDLDIVDRGSNFSNLLAIYNMSVQNGTGEEVVELIIEPRTLAQFPPASQILPIASLQNSSYPTLHPGEAYFHQVFEELALKVPDFSQLCVFDAENESLEVIKVVSPPQFTEANAKTEVTIRYNLFPSHAQIATLVGGMVNPTWAGEITDFKDWRQQTGTWSSQELETASGVITIDLYPSHTEDRRHQIDENNQAVLALALVCGHSSYNQLSQVSYSEVFSNHVFSFSSDFLNRAPATPIPNP